MKKIVTAVLLAILLLSAFAALSVPHVKAQTSQATILSYTWYTAPSNTVLAEYAGDLVAVGEVQNTGTTPLSSVFIYGAAYNSTNTGVCQVDTPLIGVPELLPGQKAPFYLDFTPENSITQDQSWVSSVTNVTLTVATVTPSNQTQYSGLTIPTGSVTGFDNSGTYTVTGTVENTGDQTTGNVWVLATFYNSAGKVVGMNCTDYLASSLAPGNAVQFTATPTDNTAQMSNEIENYSLIVESSPFTASSATPTPPPTSGSTPPPSSPSSSSKPTPAPTNSLVTYGVVAAVVIIVVVLAALMLLRTRRKNGPFESPPPPPPPPQPPTPPPPPPP